jgi:hypothetical protein
MNRKKTGNVGILTNPQATFHVNGTSGARRRNSSIARDPSLRDSFVLLQPAQQFEQQSVRPKLWSAPP